MYNTQELLGGNLPPRLERKIEEILLMANDRRNFKTDHARLRLDGTTSRAENSAPSSVTVSINERVKETIFRELVCRTRMYIGKNILRITEERSRRNLISDRILAQKDSITESENLSEENLGHIEQILDFFKELLIAATKKEAEEKKMRDLKAEAIMNAAKSPTSNPWIML